MADYVRVTFVVSVVRSFLEIIAGIWVLLVVAQWQPWTDGFGGFRIGFHPEARPDGGDKTAFTVLGAALLAFGVVRFVQALNVFRAREWSRRATIVLAAFDFLTPVTLPLGLWYLKVYRHPDTKDHFRKGRAPAPV